MSGSTGALHRFNEALIRAERAAVWLMLALMGGTMFLAVAHRPAIAMVNPLSAPGLFTAALGEEAGPAAWAAWGGTLAMFLAASLIALLALRTRGSPQALTLAPAIGLGVTVFERAFAALFPNGIVQAQPIALSLLLWLSMLGASLAAYDRRHLSVDFGLKLWPEAIRPKVTAVSQILTALFCLALVGLGTISTWDQFRMWIDSDMAAGVLSGTAIPRWFAVAAIPYGALALAFRFVLEGARAWRGELEEVDELHQLGIKTDTPSDPEGAR